MKKLIFNLLGILPNKIDKPIIALFKATSNKELSIFRQRIIYPDGKCLYTIIGIPKASTPWTLGNMFNSCLSKNSYNEFLNELNENKKFGLSTFKLVHWEYLL